MTNDQDVGVTRLIKEHLLIQVVAERFGLRAVLADRKLQLIVDDEISAGSLADLLKPLKDASVNVVFMYAFIGFSQGAKAVMIFRFSDNDKAVKILKDNGISLLDAKAFGILNR